MLILPLSKSRSTKSLGYVAFGSDTVVLTLNDLGDIPSIPRPFQRVATLFLLITSPRSCSSAVILGEP
jgi:hypothetical protein